MFKLIAQVLVSATVGLAVAAGSDANVRGYIGEALHEPGVYIQESVRAIAHTVGSVSTEANAQANAETNTQTSVNVDENASANVDASVITENAADVSVQSTTDVQVNGGLNLDAELPLLDLQTEAAADTETQADVLLEEEGTELTIWQQLGLSLGLDVEEEE
jgi:hypothetical protein